MAVALALLALLAGAGAAEMSGFGSSTLTLSDTTILELLKDLYTTKLRPLEDKAKYHALREPPPQGVRHGHGRPPDGPPDEGSWGITRGLRSMFSWPQNNAAPALPPLTSSGLQALNESGQDDGGVHRPSAIDPVLKRTNVPNKRRALALI